MTPAEPTPLRLRNGFDVVDGEHVPTYGEYFRADDYRAIRAQLTAAKAALQELVDADLQCACSSYDAPSRLRYTKAVAKARDALDKS